MSWAAHPNAGKPGERVPDPTGEDYAATATVGRVTTLSPSTSPTNRTDTRSATFPRPGLTSTRRMYRRTSSASSAAA